MKPTRRRPSSASWSRSLIPAYPKVLRLTSTVGSPGNVAEALAGTAPGQSVTVTYRRDLATARARVSSGLVAETACGPIEYAVRGTGPRTVAPVRLAVSTISDVAWSSTRWRGRPTGSCPSSR